MTTPFRSDKGLIILIAQLHGPKGSIPARLALDTGATSTVINQAPLVYVGYDPSVAAERTQVTMGGSVEYSAILHIDRLEAPGETRESLRIVAHTLPPSASMEGVLGLDFFRDRRLIIDFTIGTFDLT